MKAIYDCIEDKFKTVLLNDETALHCLRMRDLLKDFAETLNLSEEDSLNLQHGAILHDIGKFEIPSDILYKKGRLTEEQFDVIKRHVVLSKEVVDMSTLHKDVVDIILQHHERPDGKGYPYGLKGEEINYLSKIVSLIDVYEALTSVRSYKEAKTIEETLEIMKQGLGLQFDYELSMKFYEFITVKEEKCKEVI